MKKLLVIGGIVVVILGGVWFSVRHYAKSFSPETSENYHDNGYAITVDYNRPFKKGRVIFGGLVPYGKVWRTGANEATIFKTETDLKFGDQVLKAGSYSLWTIPGEASWKIIFNSETGQWGINFNGEANKDSKNDVLAKEEPVVVQDKEFEQFTIKIEKHGEEMAIVFFWDKTIVNVPFTK